MADDQDPEFVAALKLYNAKMPKYQQMFKMGLLYGAVVQKMLMEGVDTTWLDGPPQPKKKAVPVGPNEAEIAAHCQKHAQYFQKLKMGLPRGAVEHKMRMGGIGRRELDPATRRRGRSCSVDSSTTRSSLSWWWGDFLRQHRW